LAPARRFESGIQRAFLGVRASPGYERTSPASGSRGTCVFRHSPFAEMAVPTGHVRYCR
jgi:hypothetical protein